MIRNGLRRSDAPSEYGPHKTLCNRFVRWTRAGVFADIFSDLAAEAGEPERLMIDSTHLRARRTAASLLVKKGSAAHRADKGRLELQATRRLRPERPSSRADADARADQRPSRRRRPVQALPPAALLIGDQGCGSDAFRSALAARGTTACIPPRRNRNVQHAYDAGLYQTRRRVENMFAKLKDWRKVVIRYDRCGDLFMGAITVATSVIFWLPK